MGKPFQIFLLGTPGCGKSAVFRRLEQRLQQEGIATQVMRIDDFPKLHACFVADDEAEAAGKPRTWSRKSGEHGWLVTNPAVWDKLLTMVNEDILSERAPDKAVFVEFARPDMVRSIRTCFSDEVKRSSLLLYIFCPFDICWERNVRRHEAAVAAGGDDHLVSREEMEKTYLHDDHDALHQLGIPFVVIDNHLEGSELHALEVDKVITMLKTHIVTGN